MQESTESMPNVSMFGAQIGGTVRAFVFSYPGVYLGGVAFIVAADETAAIAMLREQVPHLRLERSEMRIKEVPLDEPNTGYVWDGDY